MFSGLHFPMINETFWGEEIENIPISIPGIKVIEDHIKLNNIIWILIISDPLKIFTE